MKGSEALYLTGSGGTKMPVCMCQDSAAAEQKNILLLALSLYLFISHLSPELGLENIAECGTKAQDSVS